MFYFTSRSKARIFAKAKGANVIDNGKYAAKRWAVSIF